MATLTRLARADFGKKPVLLVSQAPALMQRLPPKDVVLHAGYSAKVGDTVDMAKLERYFAVKRLPPRHPPPSPSAANSPSAAG